MCQRNGCNSNRIARVSGKVADCFNLCMGEIKYEGYVPSDIGIGGGDFINFNYCLDCGQMQGRGQFPLPQTELEYEIEYDSELNNAVSVLED